MKGKRVNLETWIALVVVVLALYGMAINTPKPAASPSNRITVTKEVPTAETKESAVVDIPEGFRLVDNGGFQPINNADQESLVGKDDTSVGGAIKFPSGAKLPQRPSGGKWVIRNGAVYPE